MIHQLRRYLKRATLAKSLIALVFIGLTVCACGDETERSAAALEDNLQNSSAPFNDVNAGALFGSGTEVCVQNSSTKTLPVRIKQADTSTGDNPLRPGTMLCVEGTYSGGSDVLFTLTMGEGNPDMRIQATNQSLGQPRFYLLQDDPNAYSFHCIYQGFASMEENSSNDGVLEYTVKRLPDTNWKEFQVVLRDDPNPSTTGKTRRCKESDPR